MRRRQQLKGLKIDGRWQATDNLLLQASVGYLNFEYDKFPNQACVAEQFLNFREDAYQSTIAVGDFGGAAAASLLINNQTCAAASVNDLKGKTSEHSPEWSASFIASHHLPLGAYELNSLMDINYTDEVYRQGDLDPVSLEDSVIKINAVMTFGPSEGMWDVSVIGKNLTEEATYSYVNDTPLFNGARQGRLDQPRSFMVRGRLHF